MNSSEIPSTAIVSVEPNLPVDHDVLARRRDNQGNRLPSRSAYDIPAAGELPLDQSQIQFLLNRLDEERPLHASWLRYFYHEKLHPAHTRFKKVLEEEQAQLAKRQ